MTLSEIAAKHHTDKETAHHYCGLYDLLFSKWRNKRVHLLEIGCQFGCSAKTWIEYFGNAQITMIDAVDNGVNEEGFTFLLGDAYSDYMLGRLTPPYDILIDDGSHIPSDQMYFVEHYLNFLRHDGLGVVEDVLSRDVIPQLESVLPKGFSSTSVEMSKGASLVDSRLFIAYRTYVEHPHPNGPAR